MSGAIGKRIRALRRERGYSQEELAAAVGTTKQTIYKYESGAITNIPTDRVSQLASYLETTPSYLMGWDDRKPMDPETIEIAETLYRRPGMKILFDAAKDAPDEVLESTANLLEAWKSGKKK